MGHFKLDGSIKNREGEGVFSSSQLKRVLKNALLEGDLTVIDGITNRVPIRKLVNPVFSFFCDAHELVRWRAVTLMGIFVSRLADQDLESARVILRRLMWSLNDESGGIGWGAPEAMGEIMARHEGLAKEYSSILVSYIREDGNFLEHPMLQRGVIWGIGRLAQTRPAYTKGAEIYLFKFFKSTDSVHRGLSAWAAGNMGNIASAPFLKNLLDDHAEILFYEPLEIHVRTVSFLAKLALSKIL
jgi:hypothetical protein